MRIPSDPVFHRLVARSAIACVAALALAALAFPPPLQEAADVGNPPNPAKSAWFLLWVQELVAHGNFWIWPAILLGIAAAALPWIPGSGSRVEPGDGTPSCERAPRAGGFFVLALLLAVALLTVVAAFFRGRNWECVWPF